MAATIFDWPSLWSGGLTWSSDATLDAGEAGWHRGNEASLTNGANQPYRYQWYTEMLADETYIVGYWPLSEGAQSVGSDRYAPTIGTVPDFDVVTAASKAGDKGRAVPALTATGIKFDGTSEVSFTNDGSIDWTGDFAIEFWMWLKEPPGSDAVIFEVKNGGAGVDGMQILIDSAGYLEVFNTDDSTYSITSQKLFDNAAGDDEEAGVWVHVAFFHEAGVGNSLEVEYTGPSYDWAQSNAWGGADNFSGLANQSNATDIVIGGGSSGVFEGIISHLAIYVGGNLDYQTEYDDSGSWFRGVNKENMWGLYTDNLDLTQTGEPTLKVAVNGYEVLEELQSANWKIGKESWFSQLEPGSCNLTFIGLLDAQPGDDIVIFCETSPLWAGTVEDVDSRRGNDNYWRTTLTGVDVFGKLGKTELEDYQNSSNALGFEYWAGQNIEYALEDAGYPYGVSEPFYTSGGWSSFVDAPFTGDLLGYINRQAELGGIFISQNTLGRLVAIEGGPITDYADIKVLPLMGDDSPSRWDERMTSSDIINEVLSESVVNGTTSTFIDLDDVASQEAYGVKAITFDPPDSWTHYSNGNYYDFINGSIGDPRPLLDSSEFHINDLQQGVFKAQPTDLVEHNDELWFVTGIEHEVTLSDWMLRMSAERTPDYFSGVDDGDPTYANPTEQSIDSQTITATIDTVIQRGASGTKRGAGAMTYLPIGRAGNGAKYRALLKFNITWPTGFVRVRKARLKMTNSDQSTFSRGANPRVEARRLTQAFTEGTESSVSTLNATVWGDQRATTAGSSVKRLTNRADDGTTTMDITDIAQGWYDNGNYGLMLKAANEFRTRNRTEFYAEDHSTGQAPQLVLECIVTP